MGIDVNKLRSKEVLTKFDQNATIEKLEQIPEKLIQFSASSTIKYCLNKKFRAKSEPSARVLNNWIEKGLVQVSPDDKGKIKRFDKIESIWINIIIELRSFGVSIPSLLRTRKILFDYLLGEFSLIKFQFLNAILLESQVLIVYKDGGARILSSKNYQAIALKSQLLPHIRLDLDLFIKPEYPNNTLDKISLLSLPFDSIEKIKLLFFLRTGDYQFLKVKITENDIRYIEHYDMLLQSDDVIQSIENWSFSEILVSIDEENSTIINGKK
ncbi:hypothetical protein LX97_00656 [Nonlabens dokdonensis]|jgi:hypothetical protein|uniref:Uncharacterized protein n=2 Tax=Nonlabens dokdonensis TaxID=328515 RepID=L7WAQ5_NONDD|nr:hypothetical protein [Nonlabens dokdonensis]AGC75978.1 hypothetical protein DDD_0851 [Nonlabens dokdonensis DSW-6]PZX43655.1 hypothetical protein LX97_00656 [Nonlabens dokdonensis]